MLVSVFGGRLRQFVTGAQTEMFIQTRRFYCNDINLQEDVMEVTRPKRYDVAALFGFSECLFRDAKS